MLRAALLLCFVAGALGQNVCTISVKNATLPTSVPSPCPLLLKPGGTRDGFGFLLPANAQGIITMKAGEKVTLACPGPQNYLQPLQPTPVTKNSQLIQETLATCVSGTNFMVGNRTISFKQLACVSYPSHIARKTSISCNNDKGAMIEVGFQVTAGFYKLLDICFDETIKSAVFSRCDLLPAIGGAQTGNYHPAAYLQGRPPFYGELVPRELYREMRENSNVSFLLGGTNGKNYTLIRGHLTSGLDFVYKAQKRTTFYYANVAPQWGTIKDKNWNKLEADIRTFATVKALSLEIYTGTHGILALPNGKELFLSDQGPSKRFIAVPKFFWKVIYDPKNHAGLAVVSVNNPYISANTSVQAYNLCSDESSRVPWIKWNLQKPEWGYGYICDVTQFRRAVNVLPSSLVVNKLLV